MSLVPWPGKSALAYTDLALLGAFRAGCVLCRHAPDRKRSLDTRMLQHAMSGLLEKTARKAAGRDADLKDVPEDIESEPDLDESHEEVVTIQISCMASAVALLLNPYFPVALQRSASSLANAQQEWPTRVAPACLQTSTQVAKALECRWKVRPACGWWQA